MANTVNGVAVDFGFTSTSGGLTISGTGVGTFIIQDASYSKNAEVLAIKDGTGTTVTRVFSDPSEDATLNYVVKGSTLADARTQATIPEVGAIISITGCASVPGLVQTNWTVEPGVSMQKGNAEVTRVTLPLKRFASITAVATAS